MDKIEPTIKVLHLIDSGGLYGAEKMLLTLCSEQIKQGLQSTILSCGTVNEEPKAIELEAKKLGIDVILWRMKSGLNRPGMHDIWKLIVEEGFTLLHSHGYKFNVLLALTRHSYPQVKVVATVHGYTTPKRFSKGWIYQWADKLLLIRLDAIIYVNQFVGMPSFLKALYGNKLAFISNGIAIDESAREFAEARDYSKTISKLLIVGRLSPEKGHLFALQALSALLGGENNNTPYTLTIAGDGPLREDLEHTVTALGLEQAVKFLGFVEDVESLYKEHDALLIPSLTEGLPITLLEAVKNGVPVFASPVGGIPNFFDERARLLLLDSDRARSIVKLVYEWQELTVDKKREITNALLKKLNQEYSLAAMTSGYADVYKESYSCL